MLQDSSTAATAKLKISRLRNPPIGCCAVVGGRGHQARFSKRQKQGPRGRGLKPSGANTPSLDLELGASRALRTGREGSDLDSYSTN
jgi:hypothetical protein